MILFAKSPVPGRVKTRLAQTIGQEAAAQLHTAFVADCLVQANELARVSHIDIELHTDVETDVWSSFAVTNCLQTPGDLGVRMLSAMRNALAAGRPQALITGTDSPTLPLVYLQQLLNLDTDVALGPTEDGGYYAISCRRVAEEMFRSVNWSTASTLSDTMASCVLAGLSVSQGSRWYDVDDFRDLERLAAEGNLPENTARIMENLYGDQRRGKSSED